jgi:prolyl-tRNA synthetase
MKPMRMSKLFFQTVRESPAEVENASHALLLRAGLVRQVAAGIFELLPLGLRIKQKIETIFRSEMEALGAQEVSLPVVQPADVWQRSGRWQSWGDDMARLQDRNGRDLCLGPTHEELFADLAGQIVSSYRQLPFVLYQIKTKFRDEPRPRAGLIRLREFTMKDAYSFDRDGAGLDAIYPRIYQAYLNIFRQCGLAVLAVESDTGMMGGSEAHEFMALTTIGEDTLVLCDRCDYRANRQIATFKKGVDTVHPPQPLEEVHTPGVNTISALASFLNIPTTETAKAIFLVAQVEDERGAPHDQFVFVVVRGDMELNETKLTNAIRARALRPATVDEIRAIGAAPGYGSPVGINRQQVLLVVDDLIPHSANLVAGANRLDWHYRNVNYSRDYTADLVVDLVAAADGHPCPTCGAALRTVRGVEVGNIFKLGTRYSTALGATYLDEKGESHPIVMGSYGIGVERLMGVLAEIHRDEHGIRWPVSVAPYQVVLVSLATEKTPEVAAAADQLYAQLLDAGLEVLYDDRNERAGVKFNDADLIGAPLRLTVGGKGLQRGEVEYKVRRSGEPGNIALGDVVTGIRLILHAERPVP